MLLTDSVQISPDKCGHSASKGQGQNQKIQGRETVQVITKDLIRNLR